MKMSNTLCLFHSRDMQFVKGKLQIEIEYEI